MSPHTYCEKNFFWLSPHSIFGNVVPRLLNFMSKFWKFIFNFLLVVTKKVFNLHLFLQTKIFRAQTSKYILTWHYYLSERRFVRKKGPGVWTVLVDKFPPKWPIKIVDGISRLNVSKRGLGSYKSVIVKILLWNSYGEYFKVFTTTDSCKFYTFTRLYLFWSLWSCYGV